MLLIQVLGVVASLFLAGLTCPAARANDNPPVTPETVDGDPPFPVQLQAMVKLFGFHEVNDLCVVAYKSAPDEPIIFWPTQDISINKYKQFSTIKSQLQYLVDQDGAKTRNTFCVIGQKDRTYLAAYVIWKTQDLLYLWLPGPSCANGPYDVEAGSDQIDLKHGLRNKADSEDDRSEMQRVYAEGILKACVKLGERFAIVK